MLMPETRIQGATLVGQRIVDAMRARAFDVGGTSLSVTVSIGVAEFSQEIASVDELVKRSDKGLYAAKASGRDRVVPG